VRLAKLSEYRDMVYAPGSRPTLDTLRRRIKEIPGGRVELGRYYDLDANDRVNKLLDAAHDKVDRLRNNPLLKDLV
jgi:hypothetical protein